MTAEEFIENLYKRSIALRLNADGSKIVADTTYAELTAEDRVYVASNRDAILRILRERAWDGTKAINAITAVYEACHESVDAYLRNTLQKKYGCEMRKVPVEQVTNRIVAVDETVMKDALFAHLHPCMVALWAAYHARDWAGIENAIHGLQGSVQSYIKEKSNA